MEILVVDDGSQRSLDAVVARYSDRLPVRLLHQKNAGPGAARNYGAKEATGEYLAFTDDDCSPRPDWLQQLVARLGQFPDALVGGRVVNTLRRNPCASASQLLIDYVYGYYNPNPDDALFFASNNWALSRRAFLEMEGFEGTRTRVASEDREFCDRWKAAGKRLVFAPDAVIGHSHVLSMRTLWRQHFGYGRGAWQFHALRHERGAGKFKPDLRFYSEMLLYPLGPRRKEQSETSPLFLSLLMVWIEVANLAGFLFEKRRATWSSS